MEKVMALSSYHDRQTNTGNNPEGFASRLLGLSLVILLGWSLVVAAGPTFAAEPTAEGIAFFESKIRPVLVAKCYQCHSAEAQAAGRLKAELLLDTSDGMLKGGESGPALVPGDKEKSLLLDAIGHKGLEMPPEGKLPGPTA